MELIHIYCGFLRQNAALRSSDFGSKRPIPGGSPRPELDPGEMLEPTYFLDAWLSEYDTLGSDFMMCLGIFD